MRQEDYGSKYQDHLLEQYKLYVEMADKVSERRGQANIYYISLVSALLALLSVIIQKEDIRGITALVLTLASMFGLFLCIVWSYNINSYRQLNSGKYRVILEMEKLLPFSCYEKEWDRLKLGRSESKYFRLTAIEKYVPAILSLPYAVLFIYSLLKILTG